MPKTNSAIPDHEVLAFAVAGNRILLSHNRKHFLRLSRSWPEDHPGMVLCTFDPDFRGQAAHIDAAVATLPEMRNQVLRVNRPS
ncbi:MAG: DUF5615 family PIN-like protein [Acidobacteriota bacterium]|nr:DUF5615 family PIN-like protein [Acidobacteriota bacterium]